MSKNSITHLTITYILCILGQTPRLLVELLQVENGLLTKLALIGLAYQGGLTVHYYLQFIFTIHFPNWKSISEQLWPHIKLHTLYFRPDSSSTRGTSSSGAGDHRISPSKSASLGRPSRPRTAPPNRHSIYFGVVSS